MKPRTRILIEASKLAHPKMDGIKRYVVELLRSLAAQAADEELNIDVLVQNQFYPIQELRGWQFEPCSSTPPLGSLDRALKRIGSLVPPILLIPVKWVMPDWIARNFFGRSKSELSVPKVRLNGPDVLALVMPPFIWQKFTQTRWGLLLKNRRVIEYAIRSEDLEQYDLIHITLPNNANKIPPTTVPKLVTVHDLSHIVCPELQTPANSIMLEVGLNRSIEDNAHYLAVSNATRAQLLEQYVLEIDKVTTVHNGCRTQYFHPVPDSGTLAQVRNKYQIPGSPYLLTLSTIEPRKNLENTLRAFQLLLQDGNYSNINLIIAGSRGWKDRRINRLVDATSRVHYAGYVADDDLAAVYSAALGFVYVSHYEGFGLPLLEAMACGVPVIHGNNSSMPELVGEAGLAADSNDVDDIARQIHRLVTDDELRKSLRHKALARAEDFSWHQAAIETVAVYKKLTGVS